jgi:hypothetical protein
VRLAYNFRIAIRLEPGLAEPGPGRKSLIASTVPCGENPLQNVYRKNSR